MGTNEQSESIIIGKDIPWGAVYGGYCRVTHFTPFATVDAGKIKDFSQPTALGGLMHYALLSVQLLVDDAHPWKTGFLFCQRMSVRLPKEASMPIVHWIDFLNLWEVFRVVRISKEEEVLVTYSPVIPAMPNASLNVEKESARLDIPRLTISIYPAGSLEIMRFEPSDTLYPRNDIPPPNCEWDEGAEEDFHCDLWGNTWPVFKHNSPSGPFKGVPSPPR